MDKTVFLICANAGMGKDTSADILCGLTGGVKMAYADPLKDAVTALVGVPKTVLYGTQEQKETFKIYGKTARQWIQWLGTDIGRKMIDENVWVDRMADRILSSTAKLVFVSDARYKNELDGLRERLTLERVAGGIRVITMRILNPRVQVNLTHASESELYHIPLTDFDIVLMNDGTLDELKTKLKGLAGQLLDEKVDVSSPQRL
jgi:hypothetical protein